MTDIRSVAVLGGGVCGLAAAWRLLQRRPDLQVTILESESRAGGMARSLRFDRLHTDLGPHRFHTEIAESLEFVKEIAGRALVEVPRKSEMWLEDRWVSYPPKPLEMLGALGVLRLGFFAGSRAMAMARSATRFATEIQGNDPSRDSFESLMVGNFGRGLFEYLVQPYAEKVWKTSTKSLHGDIARVRVSAGGMERLLKMALGRGGDAAGAATGALKKFLYIEGGYGRLCDMMVSRIEKAGGRILCGRSIVGVDGPGAGAMRSAHWTIRHVATPSTPATAQTPQTWESMGRELPPSDPHSDAFDAVVSTIPITDLVHRLTRHSPEPDAENSARGLRFLGNVLVFLIARQPKFTDSQWLYFPKKDLICNRGYAPTNFHASMGSGEKSLLCLEVTGYIGDETWSLSDDEIAKQCSDAAVRAGLTQPQNLDEIHVFRIPYTYPLYDLEYRWRTDRIWQWLGTLPRIITSGRQGLFLHNNVDHSIYVGIGAANALLDNPDKPGPPWYGRIREFQGFRIVD